MRDPDDHRDLGDHIAQQPKDALQVRPTRSQLLARMPAGWRQPAVGLLGFVLGVAAVGGALLARQALPDPSPFRADEHAVELILFNATPPRTPERGSESEKSPLRVDSALLLSGLQPSTVAKIGTTAGQGLGVRAPDLPVTISPTDRFQSIDLEIIVRECKGATRWTPGDRPFVITWRDEYGTLHTDRAGDFDRSLGRSLIRYIDAVCGSA
ncbi:MAG: hypothetical protein ACREXY_26785 [Gammaproteobacteria bacterium]